MTRKVEEGASMPATKRVSNQEIERTARERFRSGYVCAEVISTAVLEALGSEPPGAVARCASAFCGGVGGTSQELCGAFTGGVIALGYLLGRERPGESLAECGELIREFRRGFLSEFGSLNCSTLLDGFASQDNPQMACVQLTARAAQMLSDLLVKLETERGLDLRSFFSRPRGKVALGSCPFGGSGLA